MTCSVVIKSIISSKLATEGVIALGVLKVDVLFKGLGFLCNPVLFSHWPFLSLDDVVKMSKGLGEEDDILVSEKLDDVELDVRGHPLNGVCRKRSWTVHIESHFAPDRGIECQGEAPWRRTHSLGDEMVLLRVRYPPPQTEEFGQVIS